MVVQLGHAGFGAFVVEVRQLAPAAVGIKPLPLAHQLAVEEGADGVFVAVGVGQLHGHAALAGVLVEHGLALAVVVAQVRGAAVGVLGVAVEVAGFVVVAVYAVQLAGLVVALFHTRLTVRMILFPGAGLLAVGVAALRAQLAIVVEFLVGTVDFVVVVGAFALQYFTNVVRSKGSLLHALRQRGGVFGAAILIKAFFQPVHLVGVGGGAQVQLAIVVVGRIRPVEVTGFEGAATGAGPALVVHRKHALDLAGAVGAFVRRLAVAMKLAGKALALALVVVVVHLLQAAIGAEDFPLAHFLAGGAVLPVPVDVASGSIDGNPVAAALEVAGRVYHARPQAHQRILTEPAGHARRGRLPHNQLFGAQLAQRFHHRAHHGVDF